jgi:hydrogenase maturation protease
VKILVAGIGNVFLGDDGFGVEVAGRLARRPVPRDMTVVDFGIRGLDLAYALGDGYDAAIFVDVACRGRAPGTLFVFEPTIEANGEGGVSAHGIAPAEVLAMARTLTGASCPVRVVACEPLSFGGEEGSIGLSPAVEAAVEPAIELTLSVAAAWQDEVRADA